MEPEKPVIFSKLVLVKQRVTLKKIKKMTGSGLGHNVTYKHIASADNPEQLEFHCSGHSDYYIHLNSMRLPLRIKVVKIDGSDIESGEQITVGCFNNLLHSMFSSLSVSFNGRPVTLQETNDKYEAYL